MTLTYRPLLGWSLDGAAQVPTPHETGVKLSLKQWAALRRLTEAFPRSAIDIERGAGVWDVRVYAPAPFEHSCVFAMRRTLPAAVRELIGRKG